MRYIGDVHGKFDEYARIAKAVPESIQVGDFGIGFGGDPPVLGWGHRFIRGNHDKKEDCRWRLDWVLDGTIEDGVLYVGGAWSIDRRWRTEGVNWWADEELSAVEWNGVMAAAQECAERIDIIVTHDCPQAIAAEHFGIADVSSTRRCLDSLLRSIKPKVWVFGHWHRSLDAQVDGTRFICLNELEYVDL